MSWVIFSAALADSLPLKLTTTTSTKSTGLLDKLIPAFEKASDYQVIVYAVGTGKALRMGREGKVDVLMVHAPAAEKEFIAAGYGLARVSIMKNDFVIIGPAADPAGIHGMHDVQQAFNRISHSKSLFISRSDDSGTHKKEMSIWTACNIRPYGDWYFEQGSGMKQTLDVANVQQGYLLVDRGTWLASRKNISLQLDVEGDELLQNPYSLIAVNPARYSHINHKGAEAFIRWMTGPQGRSIISQLTVDDEQLFTVIAGSH